MKGGVGIRQQHPVNSDTSGMTQEGPGGDSGSGAGQQTTSSRPVSVPTSINNRFISGSKFDSPAGSPGGSPARGGSPRSFLFWTTENSFQEDMYIFFLPFTRSKLTCHFELFTQKASANYIKVQPSKTKTQEYPHEKNSILWQKLSLLNVRISFIQTHVLKQV